MNYKPQPLQLVLLIAVLCGATVGGTVWYRSRILAPADYLKRLPLEDSVVLWMDFDALRQGGILKLFAGAKAEQDPEYQAFVSQTRFNYIDDLDNVMAAFAPGGNFFLVKGKFDWRTLRQYAQSQQGTCQNALCRMNGSTDARHISFFPVRSNVLAMAVSPDSWGVLDLQHQRPGVIPSIPNAPIWLAFSGSVLKSNPPLPDGARPFARALQNAISVTISFAPEGSRLAARLQVRSASPRDAAELAAQLTATTELVRSLIAREHKQPNPADFSGIFTSGTFKAEGATVSGYWPIETAFVTNLLGSE